MFHMSEFLDNDFGCMDDVGCARRTHADAASKPGRRAFLGEVLARTQSWYPSNVQRTTNDGNGKYERGTEEEGNNNPNIIKSDLN